MRQLNLPTDGQDSKVNQYSLSQALLRNPATLSELRATNNLTINCLLQFIFTARSTGRSYTFMVYDDGMALYDNDNEKAVWSQRG